MKQYDIRDIEPPLSLPEVFMEKLSGAQSYFKPLVAHWLEAQTIQGFGASAIWTPLRSMLLELQKLAQLNDPKSMYVYCVACARI
jgi:hypothetical protein